MKFAYNSTMGAYFYDIPVFGQNLASAQEFLDQTKKDNLANNRTYEFEVEFAMINSNTYMISHVVLKLILSTAGLTRSEWDISTFRIDPYLLKKDRFRIKLEVLYFIIFIIMLAEEIFILISILNKVDIFIDDSQVNKNSSFAEKAVSGFRYVLNLVKTFILRILLGVLKYISNFSNLLTFVGLICTIIGLQ